MCSKNGSVAIDFLCQCIPIVDHAIQVKSFANFAVSLELRIHLPLDNPSLTEPWRD